MNGWWLETVTPVMPGGRKAVVVPLVAEALPPGLDAASFNESDLMQELNGGLIVYDVDEEAPMFMHRSKSDFATSPILPLPSSPNASPIDPAATAVSSLENGTVVSSVDGAGCPLTERGLLILVSVLCGVAGLLGLLLWLTCLRLGKLRKSAAKSERFFPRDAG